MVLLILFTASIKQLLHDINGPHHAKTCFQAYADSDVQSDQGIRCLLTESLDTTECMNGEEKPRWYFVHAQDDLNLCILLMFERFYFSLDADQITIPLGTHWLYEFFSQPDHVYSWFWSTLLVQEIFMVHILIYKQYKINCTDVLQIPSTYFFAKHLLKGIVSFFWHSYEQ